MKKWLSTPLLLASLLLASQAAPAWSSPQSAPTQIAAQPTAQIKTQLITYQDGDQVLEGYLAYNAAQTGKRPGILIVHEWTGMGAYVKHRAEQLAKMGYVAFAADIYGKGVHPKPPQEAGQMAGKYKGNRALFRSRLKAGYQMLLKQAQTDPAKTAAIGYCFGGTGALEL
ncbi:hypothetical protein COW20_19005, partial [bacterium (Candidatus Blackallbacteria) CG13_big_fil_rev_8_21_14_2_50_49_14]